MNNILCSTPGCRFHVMVKEYTNFEGIKELRYVEGFNMLVPAVEAQNFKLHLNCPRLCIVCQRAYDAGMESTFS